MYYNKIGGSTQKYVCFHCQKSFHRAIPHCVECQGVVYFAGSAFKAPKKQDHKAWKTLEILIVQAHIKFFNRGSGYIPKNVSAAKKLVLNKIRALEP